MVDLSNFSLKSGKRQQPAKDKHISRIAGMGAWRYYCPRFSVSVCIRMAEPSSKKSPIGVWPRV